MEAHHSRWGPLGTRWEPKQFIHALAPFRHQISPVTAKRRPSLGTLRLRWQRSRREGRGRGRGWKLSMEGKRFDLCRERPQRSAGRFAPPALRPSSRRSRPTRVAGVERAGCDDTNVTAPSVRRQIDLAQIDRYRFRGRRAVSLQRSDETEQVDRTPLNSNGSGRVMSWLLSLMAMRPWGLSHGSRMAQPATSNSRSPVSWTCLWVDIAIVRRLRPIMP